MGDELLAAPDSERSVPAGAKVRGSDVSPGATEERYG